MARIAGRLIDFGFGVPPGSRIKLQPASAGLGIDGFILAGSPIYIYPDGTGTFSDDIYATEHLLVPVAMFVSIECFVDGLYVPWKDFPGWIVHVPNAGGNLVDMIDVPMTSDLVSVSVKPPANPVVGSGWVDISGPVGATVPYYEWEI